MEGHLKYVVHRKQMQKLLDLLELIAFLLINDIGVNSTVHYPSLDHRSPNRYSYSLCKTCICLQLIEVKNFKKG